MTATLSKPLETDGLLRRAAVGRLLVAGVLLVAMPLVPVELMPGRQTAVLVLALVAVLATSTPLVVFRLAQPRRIAWLTCLLDVVLVTAVVAATGAARSIFIFLYVLAVTGASLLLSRTGALAVAAGSSVLYSGLIFGRTVFPFAYLLEPPGETTALEVLSIFLNSGTFLVVAFVAGGLAQRFHATRRELEAHRKDLRDLQAFKDVIMKSMGTGLIAVDSEHTITALNPAAEAIAGRPRHELIGRPWSVLFGPEVPLAAVESAIRDKPRTSPRRETMLHCGDGGPVPVRLTFSALTAEDGAPLGLVAVCEDLSEIREMEARMRQADRLATLGRMAANIAHEIRNPLASLTGAIEALAVPVTEDPTRERLIQIVTRESERLNGLITRFLEYARPAPVTAEAMDVSAVIDEVLVLVEHRDLPPGLKITRDFPASLTWRLDAQRLRQALWNLCLNGVEAMPSGGELVVAAREQRDALMIVVSDTGAGVPAGDLPHLFEPFFSTKSGGSGLGLAVVDRAIRDHGGEIAVRSRPGHGTTFTITLPQCPSPGREPLRA